ncbi:type II toxin-antitoxin system YoeB family toxin [Natronospirillum operosum]|nr:type II toxin-antitoxin system YoeB family toxin [Natronospirillum operosum]
MAVCRARHFSVLLWSRRINDSDHMVYKVTDDALYIIAHLRYHC